MAASVWRTKRFVNEGAHVFITGRRDAELTAAAKEIGTNVTGVQRDEVNGRNRMNEALLPINDMFLVVTHEQAMTFDDALMSGYLFF